MGHVLWKKAILLLKMANVRFHVNTAVHTHTNASLLFTAVSGKLKMSTTNDFSNFFSLVSGQLKSRKRKNSFELLLRKSDLKFPTYLMMARNWSKSLKKVCERGLGLTNDTNNFSSPYPL